MIEAIPKDPSHRPVIALTIKSTNTKLPKEDYPGPVICSSI